MLLALYQAHSVGARQSSHLLQTAITTLKRTIQSTLVPEFLALMNEYVMEYDWLLLWLLFMHHENTDKRRHDPDHDHRSGSSNEHSGFEERSDSIIGWWRIMMREREWNLCAALQRFGMVIDWMFDGDSSYYVEVPGAVSPGEAERYGSSGGKEEEDSEDSEDSEEEELEHDDQVNLDDDEKEGASSDESAVDDPASVVDEELNHDYETSGVDESNSVEDTDEAKIVTLDTAAYRVRRWAVAHYYYHQVPPSRVILLDNASDSDSQPSASVHLTTLTHSNHPVRLKGRPSPAVSSVSSLSSSGSSPFYETEPLGVAYTEGSTTMGDGSSLLPRVAHPPDQVLDLAIDDKSTVSSLAGVKSLSLSQVPCRDPPDLMVVSAGGDGTVDSEEGESHTDEITGEVCGKRDCGAIKRGSIVKRLGQRSKGALKKVWRVLKKL